MRHESAALCIDRLIFISLCRFYVFSLTFRPVNVYVFCSGAVYLAALTWPATYRINNFMVCISATANLITLYPWWQCDNYPGEGQGVNILCHMPTATFLLSDLQLHEKGSFPPFFFFFVCSVLGTEKLQCPRDPIDYNGSVKFPSRCLPF